MQSLHDTSFATGMIVAILLAASLFGAMAGLWAGAHALYKRLPASKVEKMADVTKFLFKDAVTPPEAIAFVVFAECLITVALVWVGLSVQGIVFVLLILVALPAFLYYRGAGKRTKDLELALPMALQQVANELAAGATIETALRKVRKTAPAPADVEVLRLLRRVEVMGVDAAFEEMAEVLNSRSFSLTASVVRVGTSSGGQLVSALKSLSQTLIEIERLNRKIRTASENGRRNLYLISAVGPLVAWGSFNAVDHQVTVMDDPFGQVLIGVALLMAIAAHAAGAAMTKVKV